MQSRLKLRRKVRDAETKEFAKGVFARPERCDTPLPGPAPGVLIEWNKPRIQFTMLRGFLMYPRKHSAGAAGFDVIMPEDVDLVRKTTTKVPLSFRIDKCPVGHYFLMAGRSSFTLKHPMLLVRGVVDCDYRGEVFLMVTNMTFKTETLKAGDCVAQMVLTKCACSEEMGMDRVHVAFRETEVDAPTETHTSKEVRGEASFPMEAAKAMDWVYQDHVDQEQDPDAEVLAISSDEEEEELEGLPTMETLVISCMPDEEDDDIPLVDNATLIAEMERQEEEDVLGHVKKCVFLEGTCCTGKTTMAGERAGGEEASMDFMKISQRYPYMRQKVTNVYLDMLYASVTSHQMMLHPKTDVWDRAPWSGMVYRFMMDEQAHLKCGYQPNWKKPTPRQHRFSMAVCAMRDMCQTNGLNGNWLDVVMLVNSNLPYAVKLVQKRASAFELALPNISHYIHAQNVIFCHVAVLLGGTPIVDMAKHKVGDHDVAWHAYAQEVSDAVDLVVAAKMSPRGQVPSDDLQDYKF